MPYVTDEQTNALPLLNRWKLNRPTETVLSIVGPTGIFGFGLMPNCVAVERR